MDNLTQNERETADTAEAEESKAAAALGKFKDVKTLLKAYSDLEAEFTRRSQRLKELENGNKAATPSDGTSEPSSEQSEKERIESAKADEKIRDAIIGDYLKGLAENKVPLIAGGEAVSASRNSPKSVKEAGKLVRRFLNS